MTTDADGLTWYKSSYSGSQENCVEIAAEPGAVHIRDSKNPRAGVLFFATGDPAAFLRDMANGTS